MNTRADIVREARALLGTPYQHQGRMPGVGLDCVGVPIVIGRTLGLVAPDFDVNGYSRQPDGKSLIAYCDQYLTRIEESDMGLGDIMVTATQSDPNHFAILADYQHGGLSMIHALVRSNGRGGVIEHRLAAWVMARFVAAYRFPGVAA